MSPTSASRQRTSEQRTLAGVALLGALSALALAGAFLLPGFDDQKQGRSPTGAVDGQAMSRSSCGREQDGLVDRLDMDNDGRADEVFWGYDAGELVLRVCTATGRRSEVFGRGMGEEYFAIDVEPDGHHELLVGGNTVSMAVTDVVVFRNGRLEAVVGPASDRLSVYDGWRFHERALVEDTAWGCDDVTGDGHRELIQATVTWPPAGPAHVAVEAYRLDGARAVVVPVPQPADQELPREIGAAVRFSGDCT